MLDIYPKLENFYNSLNKKFVGNISQFKVFARKHKPSSTVK